MTDSRDRSVRLVLRALVTVREGEATKQLTVHCPVHAGAQALEHCRGCARLERETSSALVCRAPEAAPDKAVGEFIAPNSVTFDGELGVETAAHHLRRVGANAAAVVDDVGVVVGEVRLEALDQACVEQAERRSFERVAPPEVEDVMDGHATVLLESASIRDAARLMVERRTSALSVVNAHGHAVGTVEIFDVLGAFLSDSDLRRKFTL